MTKPVLSLGTPDYTALQLPPPPDERPYVLINMVSSVDGKVTVEGTERGLGSPVDQRLMRELRVNADVVMNGAGTMRASGTTSRVGAPELEALRRARGLEPHPIAAVISASGDLPLDRTFFTARDFEAVVYLDDDAPLERRRAIEATGREVVVVPGSGRLRKVLAHMRVDLRARVLLVEGGPTLNGELFALGLVDEYFSTLGPVIVGGNATLTAVRGEQPPSLGSVTRLGLISSYMNPETSEHYLRYRVTERPGQASGGGSASAT